MNVLNVLNECPLMDVLQFIYPVTEEMWDCFQFFPAVLLCFITTVSLQEHGAKPEMGLI